MMVEAVDGSTMTSVQMIKRELYVIYSILENLVPALVVVTHVDMKEK